MRGRALDRPNPRPEFSCGTIIAFSFDFSRNGKQTLNYANAWRQYHIRLTKESASLRSKSVRLWSGMDNGNPQEVRLRCTPEGRLGFELAAGQEIALIPLDPSHIHAVLAGREVSIEVPSGNC